MHVLFAVSFDFFGWVKIHFMNPSTTSTVAELNLKEMSTNRQRSRGRSSMVHENEGLSCSLCSGPSVGFRWRGGWTRTSLWPWPAPTPPRSSTFTPARVASPWAQTPTSCCGTPTAPRSSPPRPTTRYEPRMNIEQNVSDLLMPLSLFDG